MTVRTYSSAESFKQALDQRLHDIVVPRKRRARAA